MPRASNVVRYGADVDAEIAKRAEIARAAYGMKKREFLEDALVAQVNRFSNSKMASPGQANKTNLISKGIEKCEKRILEAMRKLDPSLDETVPPVNRRNLRAFLVLYQDAHGSLKPPFNLDHIEDDFLALVRKAAEENVGSVFAQEKMVLAFLEFMEESIQRWKLLNERLGQKVIVEESKPSGPVGGVVVEPVTPTESPSPAVVYSKAQAVEESHGESPSFLDIFSDVPTVDWSQEKRRRRTPP